jgi:hypothetical protein
MEKFHIKDKEETIKTFRRTLEMFKGRFGNFYLYKIWGFTVVFGAILSSFIDSIPDFPLFDKDFYSLTLLEIIYGIVLCIPSLIISEIFYKMISKSKLSNQIIFLITLAVSLITTIFTYYRFFSDPFGSIKDNFFYTFSVAYSICLIIGFFIFKRKPEKL